MGAVCMCRMPIANGAGMRAMRRVVVIGIVIAVVMAGGLTGVLAFWPSPTQAAPPGRAGGACGGIGPVSHRCPSSAC